MLLISFCVKSKVSGKYLKLGCKWVSLLDLMPISNIHIFHISQFKVLSVGSSVYLPPPQLSALYPTKCLHAKQNKKKLLNTFQEFRKRTPLFFLQLDSPLDLDHVTDSVCMSKKNTRLKVRRRQETVVQLVTVSPLMAE